MDQQLTRTLHDAPTGEARGETAAGRCDIYIRIHKALRAVMADVLLRTGRLDVRDTEAMAETLDAVRGMIELCRMHLDKENRHIHPALEARRPGSSAAVAEDHDHHVRECDALERAALGLEQAAPAARGAAAAALYRRLARFVADNLLHMDVEEDVHNRVLWEEYSDDEILAIEKAIVAAVEPRQLAAVMRWMVPSVTPDERAALFCGMRATAPAAVFEGALAAARPLLSADDWHKLMTALSG